MSKGARKKSLTHSRPAQPTTGTQPIQPAQRATQATAAPTSDAATLAALTEEEPLTPVEITWGANADSSTVAASALEVIKELCRTAGETSCLITSTARDATAQARAMYNNLESTGVAAQRALYGPFGDQVIDTYEASKAAGKTADEIKADMAAKITEVGPSNVSKHCADPTVLAVVDIAPSSITNKTRFVEAALAHSGVSKYLGPPNDPAYHLEIPV